MNVKEITALRDVSTVANFEIKPNFQLLGPKYEKEVGKVVGAIKQADTAEVFPAVSANQQIVVGGYTLEPDEVIVEATDKEGFAVVTEQGYSAAVTTGITPELELEGHARELVHIVQNMRRDAGFDIADRITIFYTGDAKFDEVVAVHNDYVRQETLSGDLVKGDTPDRAFVDSHRVNGLDVKLGVVKIE